MISEAPPFWWQKADWRAWGLYPFSYLYGVVAGARMRRTKRKSVPVPVLCVGNFTVGGAGKTPTAIALCRQAKAMGLKPGFLSRGYGGSIDVPTLVDPAHHLAAHVGDEPLLLTREAPTVISRNRIDGARILADMGVDLIIMDDGFQSARLAIDFALVVVDTMRGIGNGHMLPGGPVRAPLGQQLRMASALLVVGNGHGADDVIRRAARAGRPAYLAHSRPLPNPELSGKKVLAYAGIADPAKFFRTLEALGAEICVRREFGDHQHLQDDEIADLLDHAEANGYLLVTTSKDHVRLAGHHGRAHELAEKSHVVDIELLFDDQRAPGKIIDQTVVNFRKRRLAETEAERRAEMKKAEKAEQTKKASKTPKR
ncbi:tetraacyldisaccharide 4'-kinase [Rhizobium sp. PAMB 3182]